jgi:hypothetical protein
MLVKITTITLVLIDVLIDPLVTDGYPFLAGQPVADFLRAPVFTQENFNSIPLVRGDP